MYGIIGILIMVGIGWALWNSDSKETPRHKKTYYSDLNHTLGKGIKKTYKVAKRQYNTYKFRDYSKGDRK